MYRYIHICMYTVYMYVYIYIYIYICMRFWLLVGTVSEAPAPKITSVLAKQRASIVLVVRVVVVVVLVVIVRVVIVVNVITSTSNGNSNNTCSVKCMFVHAPWELQKHRNTQTRGTQCHCLLRFWLLVVFL